MSCCYMGRWRDAWRARGEGPGWPCFPYLGPPASSGASYPYLRASAPATPHPQGLLWLIPSCH